MIVMGAETLARPDGKAIQNYVNQIGATSNVINEEEAWNGINILHTDASKVGALDLGIATQKPSGNKAKVVFLLGADNFRPEDIPEDAYVIYLGTTGDEGAYYADLILPGASYLEKQSTFVNTDGRVQQTRAALGCPGFARDDWMVLRALSEELGTPLPYDSLDEIRTRLAELAPHLVRYDVVEPSSIDHFANKPNGHTNLSRALLTDTVDNFYMTDSISKQSSVMAKCTKELNPLKATNFKLWHQTWITH
jgi:NADH dehydrogenase (ubiquinone) Fe-S protein 1